VVKKGKKGFGEATVEISLRGQGGKKADLGGRGKGGGGTCLFGGKGKKKRRGVISLTIRETRFVFC